jgi:hypothetical protein
MTQEVCEVEARSLVELLLEALVGGLSGCIVGELVNELHGSCSPHERDEWEKNRILHHGDVGCLAVQAGGTLKSPFLLGIGIGLMISDAKDANKWIVPKYLSPTG